MADKENLFPAQIKWVAVPFEALVELDKQQRWGRQNHHVDPDIRNLRRVLAIDNFLDTREVRTALENHA